MSAEENRRRANRSYDERIAELEAEILRQKQRLEAKKERSTKKREVSAAIKGIPKVAKKLQEFAALALADKRMDIFNSVSMFLAGLQRMYNEEVANRGDSDASETSAMPEHDSAVEETAHERAANARGHGRDVLLPHRSTGATPRASASTTPPSQHEPRTEQPARTGPAPATKAERMFDERLRAVAKDGLRKKVDGTSLSEWER